LSNLLLNVSLGLQEIIQFGLVILIPSTADVLNHIATKEVQVLINDEVPNLRPATLVVGG
jgi:hypothetical protein